jgi:hypothetical protein
VKGQNLLQGKRITNKTCQDTQSFHLELKSVLTNIKQECSQLHHHIWFLWFNISVLIVTYCRFKP